MNENEKIRKDIKRAISVALDYSYFDKKTANNCLAWLEKQGQTFTPKDVDDAYLKGVSDTKHKLEKQGEEKPIFNVVDWQPSKVDGKIHNIYNSGVEPKFSEKKELKKIENSPILSNSAKTGKNWSEEDEKCIDNCCLLIGAADNRYEKTFKDDCIHYLQNLKKKNESMTREEQIIEASQLYAKHQQKPFMDGALWADAHPNDEVLKLRKMFESDPDAYKQGYKKAIEKACEFLKSYRQETPDGMGYIVGIINDETIEDFRKYMEEQQ